MTTAEAQKLIGQTGTIAVQGDGDMRVQVEVTDTKTAYGNVRVQVSPILGSGSAWVNLSRVRLDGAVPTRRVISDEDEANRRVHSWDEPTED